ncbi:MAG: hypothetical protein IT259_14930 [Saprospiraceae bacterium]|nr:hypothetical protein [Saprospiraceae bacterium]
MKNLFLLLVFLFFQAHTFACDVCGCSVGGPYFGVLPQYHRNVIGLRGYDSRFDIEHPYTHHGEPGFSNDRFRSLELWGRFNPFARVQVLAAVPFHFLESQAGDVTERSTGFGDVSLLATYAVVNNIRCGAWRHQLQLGGGAKLPTGRFNPAYTDEPGLQRGTGGWDALLSGIYTLRFRQVGLNTDATFRYTGKSPDHYQFGNRFSAGARLFYWKEWNKGLAILPNGGVLYERSEKDYHQGELLDYTGGDCLLATAGLDVYFQGITLGATVKAPVSQHLAGGYTRAHERFVVNLAWMF